VIARDRPEPTSTAQLLEHYDRPGPRYTSYPTAVEFHDGFGEFEYREHLAAADAHADEPLSLYAHLPFCEARCLYCGCNIVVTRQRGVAADYLENLLLELDLLASALPHRRLLSQMHWGGGTPTYYPAADLERLFHAIAERFQFMPDAEVGIEVDPRVTSPEQLRLLRRLGFNRVSMGIQDFDPRVQEAVHRVQSFEMTAELIRVARTEGFRSVNVDLIYGLPYQTLDGFQRTLDQVAELRPERVAVYSFAFVPWIKPHMNHIPAEALPAPAVKLALLAGAIDAFTRCGYRTIGMDHFALPGDDLARALDDGSLNRNFMGYTVQSASDLVALGISGIGDVRGAFAQNTKKLPEYAAALADKRFPIARGYALDGDDVLRRHVITRLMCDARLDLRDVERRFGISFTETFAAELEELSSQGPWRTDGLLALTPDAIELTALGRMFVRNVCMVFDRHLRRKAASERPVFSRTV